MAKDKYDYLKQSKVCICDSEVTTAQHFNNGLHLFRKNKLILLLDINKKISEDSTKYLKTFFNPTL